MYRNLRVTIHAGAALVSAVGFGALVLAAAPAGAAGDVARGEVLYQGCEDCHSIEKNDVGPMHKGVVGRTAGTVPGYNYSPALRNAKIIWTEDNLDKWLSNPQLLVQRRRCSIRFRMRRIARISSHISSNERADRLNPVFDPAFRG
jgi:cytochrome c